MKLVLPLEHRVQLAAEVYGDDDLQSAALEIAQLKKRSEYLEKTNRAFASAAYGLTGLCVAVAALLHFFPR